MLEAETSAGTEAHLLTYGHGSHPIDPTFHWHRLADVPPVRSTRSGPSLGKLALDGQLIARIAWLTKRIEPRAIVAHHVEAAAAALAARARPVVFFAHTSLRHELPMYGPVSLQWPLAQLGARIDRQLGRRADVVATVAPALATLMESTAGAAAHYVPPPWPVADAMGEHEREQARRAYGLQHDAEVILYAGNLDAYQGWEHVLHALARLSRRRDRVRLLVASESPTGALVAEARRAGIADRLLLGRLKDEASRGRAHAAADVAVVPRRAPGGLPIKMLDAMARGVPTVAARRATAGLPLQDAASITADDDPEALRQALQSVLDSPEARTAQGTRGRHYVATHHHPTRFTRALSDLVQRTCAGRTRS
jgi:glycosyltransferase involved in cell wall biosynthesis